MGNGAGTVVLIVEDDFKFPNASTSYIKNLFNEGSINSASLALVRLSDDLHVEDFVFLKKKIDSFPVKKRKGVFFPTSCGRNTGKHMADGHGHK